MYEFDKYANTVLMAYSVSAVIIFILLWATLIRAHRIKQKLHKLQNPIQTTQTNE